MDKALVLAIVGPTASGKSALAVKLATKFNGEVISADSRQVYRGLDLGTGKITKEEMAGIPHYLLDVADPKRRFTVAQYQKLAYQKIREILRRGKLPIICGGSGFYIQAVVDGLTLPDVKPDQKLRQRLKTRSTSELFNLLKKLDPERASDIDPHNPHRLIRAIEIATALGKVPKVKSNPPPYEFIQLGITLPPEKLQQKIRTRLHARLKAGLVTEVARLHNQGVSWERLEEFGLEYQFVARHLQNPNFDFQPLLETAINQYAKRQLTWFKRDKRIIWIASARQAQARLGRFYSHKPASSRYGKR